jgi:hypothetical protein
MKQNKTAIFIRGYKRTWDWIKNDTFKTFNQAYGDDIDWYVAVWNSNTAVYDSMLKDFDGKNLKSFHMIDEKDYPMPITIRGYEEPGFLHKWTHKIDTYWRLAYLDQLLGIDKIKYEFDTGIQYDTVLFTRFDLYNIIGHDNKKYVKPKPFTISSETTRDEDLDFSIIDDWQYITDSLTSDIVSFRFFDTYINDYYNQATPLSPETLLSSYMFRNSIAYDAKTAHRYFTSFIIRPDQVDIFPLPSIINVCRPNSHPPWLYESIEYKLHHCNKTNIDPIEYHIR